MDIPAIEWPAAWKSLPASANWRTLSYEARMRVICASTRIYFRHLSIPETFREVHHAP